jgi:hypothetical protein
MTHTTGLSVHIFNQVSCTHVQSSVKYYKIYRNNLLINKIMGKCTFNLIWLDNCDYKEWLATTADKYTASCKLCKDIIKLSTMGERSLRSHMNSKKHTNRQTAISMARSKQTSMSSFLSKPLGSSTTAEPMACSSSTGTDLMASGSATPQQHQQDHEDGGSRAPNSVSLFMIRTGTQKAEILWCIRTVLKHQSLKHQ